MATQEYVTGEVVGRVRLGKENRNTQGGRGRDGAPRGGGRKKKKTPPPPLQQKGGEGPHGRPPEAKS